jgi:hypothetical protein
MHNPVMASAADQLHDFSERDFACGGHSNVPADAIALGNFFGLNTGDADHPLAREQSC